MNARLKYVRWATYSVHRCPSMRRHVPGMADIGQEDKVHGDQLPVNVSTNFAVPRETSDIPAPTFTRDRLKKADYNMAS